MNENENDGSNPAAQNSLCFIFPPTIQQQGFPFEVNQLFDSIIRANSRAERIMSNI